MRSVLKQRLFFGIERYGVSRMLSMSYSASIFVVFLNFPKLLAKIKFNYIK